MSPSPEHNDSTPAEKAPRGIRFVIRLWGAIAALIMISTGLFVLITVTAHCLIAGILQICVGVIVLPLEAPIFCSYFTLLIKLSDWVENKFRFWMRAALYFAFGMPPFFLCLELSTFLGCGSLLVLAALYGVLAIGKKGSESSTPRANKTDDVEATAKLMTNTGDPNDDLNTY